MNPLRANQRRAKLIQKLQRKLSCVNGFMGPRLNQTQILGWYKDSIPNDLGAHWALSSRLSYLPIWPAASHRVLLLPDTVYSSESHLPKTPCVHKSQAGTTYGKEWAYQAKRWQFHPHPPLFIQWAEMLPHNTPHGHTSWIVNRPPPSSEDQLLNCT